MNNNVYIRANKSIKTISLMHILLLLPLIIYGFYKNGIYLYKNNYINFITMFKPLLFIFIGALIGVIINIIYELLINKSKDNIINIIFSSFHVEYGIILGCITSINTNIYIFSAILFIVFFISKFLKDRINIMAFTFIVIYFISNLYDTYIYENTYELSKTFSLDFLDYLLGRGAGGIASTHIILLIISMIILYVTNNIKIEIPIYSIISYILLIVIYCISTNKDINTYIFLYNNLFMLSYMASDSVTSSYTINGKRIYGVLIGILTFAFMFINKYIACALSILIVSLFNNLIDRIANKLKREE